MKHPSVVLISGCSSGIGFETALEFARRGHSVYAGIRNPDAAGAKQLREIAEEEHLPLQLVTLDVTDDKSIAKAVAFILKETKSINILINNAGFGFLGAVEDFSIEEVKEQYDTNVFGFLRMIQAVAPSMREQKSGLIINVSSINGLLSFPLFGIYSSTKFAIETLSQVLRFELAPFGIKVAMIEPGSFLTRFGFNLRHPHKQGTSKSPYKALTDPFFTRYHRANTTKHPLLLKLLDPKRVSRRIYTIAASPHPKLHNVIGLDSHLYLFLNAILPDRLKFWLLQKAFHWS